MPAARAPSIDLSAPSRSTVRLRSMLPSGPPPAAKTTASQPCERLAERLAVRLLDVEQPDLGAELLELGALVVAADQRDRLPAGLDAAAGWR